MRSRLFTCLTAVLLCGLASAAAADRQPVVAPRPQLLQPAPPVGWTTEARVLSVYDADTITVEVRRVFRVRLIGVYAPEVRGPERPQGLLARDWLRRQIPAGSRLILHVPTTEDTGDAWSMSRIVGRVWIPGDGVPLDRRIIEAGHGTREKE